MATKTRNPGMARSAAEDLTGKLYHFGFINGDEKIAVAKNGKVGFPLQSVGQAGRDATIEFSGMSKAKLGGTVAAEDFLKTDAQGRAVKAAAGDKYVGKAVTAGVLNDVISFFIEHGTVPA